MTALTKKLSVAKVWGKVKPKDIPETGVKNLFSVIGVAQGTKTGTSDFGDWTALLGRFEAVNYETGEAFASANLFLPSVAQDMIEAQLSGGATGVHFAFNIGIQADESSSVGYTYTAEPIMPPDEKDPLAEMRALIAANNAPALENNSKKK